MAYRCSQILLPIHYGFDCGMVMTEEQGAKSGFWPIKTFADKKKPLDEGPCRKFALVRHLWISAGGPFLV